MRRSMYLSDTEGLEGSSNNSNTDGYDESRLENDPPPPPLPFENAADNGAAIVRNIASFLTLSDAASLASIGGDDVGDVDQSPADSWAVGVELEPASCWTSLATPPTPALVALSPGATPAHPTVYVDTTGCHDDEEISSYEDSDYMEQVLQERKRLWAQEKLAAAVFAHPQSIRSFCLDAYAAARDIRNKKTTVKDETDPETLIEPSSKRKRKRSHEDNRLIFVHELVVFIFDSVPLSVLLDVIDAVGGLSLETTYASFTLTGKSVNGVLSALGHIIRVIWDAIANFNPFQLLEAIISLQFNAMGKTSEVLVSGIQSVATGVESASSMALNRLSVANLSVTLSAKRTGSSSSLAGNSHKRRGRGSHNKSGFNKNLIRKLSAINDAAPVVMYKESGDDTGGLTRHAISRTRRMMHYRVPLRPFTATVALKPNDPYNTDGSPSSSTIMTHDEGEPNVSPLHSVSPNGSPIICSPSSFPPSPQARQMAMVKGSRFSDNVVFLARDKLRVHGGLSSEDERTRSMSQALGEGKRLAIFDGEGATGIELSCGQHIVTKDFSNMHYASTRSMVAVLRNCYVYFEMTVMPQAAHNLAVQASPVTLSIGLSTAEMPPNTLVGAWQGSIGLCTTGQIFVAGQWCSPADPSMSAYGYSATVGCLVFLDDSSAFETWDGVMVNASVAFSINGVLVPPPVSTLPLPGVASAVNRLNSPHMRAGRALSPASSSDEASPRNSSGYITQTLLVPASEELYPTVTLQTPATAVMCHFSSEDIIAVSRETIGAPNGATVYGVDGSVIFPQE